MREWRERARQEECDGEAEASGGCRAAAAVERLERQPTPEPAGPAVLQLSADGAMISLVGKQWVEVKPLALGRVIPAADGTTRTTDLSYVARRAEHTAFRRLVLVETERRGVGTALEVVAVMGGADWLQRFIDCHRPDAIRILDFPHAVEYLTHARHEAHGAGTAATSEWLATQAHALKHDGPTPVLAALRAVPPGAQRDVAQAAAQALMSSSTETPAALLATTPSTLIPPTPPTLPTRKTIITGRPTTAHPWTRRFLPHRPASPPEY